MQQEKISEQAIYHRTCFSTDAGRRVLAYLLVEGGVFDTDLKTPEDIAVRNYAMKIIKNMGICNSPESVTEFVNKLFEMKME